VHAGRSRVATQLWAGAGVAFAAVLVLAVGVRWVVAHVEPREGQRYATEVGGREAVALADGSRVTLNTRTRGRAVVNERRRHFWLEEGEAYFEVAHDPQRPFVITAGDDTITVLGTRFSVRHVGGRTEVTVVEGRVRLDLARPGGGAPAVPVVVTRNEAAIAERGSVLVIGRTEGQVASELSWRKGQISFDQKTVAEIALEFNRYNRVQLVVEGEAANLRLSGNFDTENVEAFARLAHEGLGLRLQRDGDRIILSGM
jgi:transmembrane sensor